MPRPLLLGHRGLRLPGGPRENTLAAFDRALELGCDGFEFDVRLTADDQAVICHDPQYRGSEIAKVLHGELQQLCLLDEVIERYGGRAFLDIELKVPGVEARVLANLQKKPPQHGFVVSSFYPGILDRVRVADKRVPLGFICDRESALVHWRELPVEYVIPHHTLLQRDLLRELQGYGKKVMVWTVNDAKDILRFQNWGVDGIISDNPALLVETLRESE